MHYNAMLNIKIFKSLSMTAGSHRNCALFTSHHRLKLFHVNPPFKLHHEYIYSLLSDRSLCQTLPFLHKKWRNNLYKTSDLSTTFSNEIVLLNGMTPNYMLELLHSQLSHVKIWTLLINTQDLLYTWNSACWLLYICCCNTFLEIVENQKLL